MIFFKKKINLSFILKFIKFTLFEFNILKFNLFIIYSNLWR